MREQAHAYQQAYFGNPRMRVSADERMAPPFYQGNRPMPAYPPHMFPPVSDPYYLDKYQQEQHEMAILIQQHEREA